MTVVVAERQNKLLALAKLLAKKAGLRSRHAFQLAHFCRLFRNRGDALLEHRFVDAAKEPARRRELYLLRGVESALCRIALRHDGDGLLARAPDGQGARSTIEEMVAGGECLHEPEHARFLQVREFPAPEFSMGARARRTHLPAAASRHSAAGRHFVLHFSFSLLHTRHLSRRFAADAVAARFHSRRIFLSPAGRRTDRARRRFSSAARSSSTPQNKPVSLGPGPDDARALRKNRSRRYFALGFG